MIHKGKSRSFLLWLAILLIASKALSAEPMEVIRDVIVAVSHDRTRIDERIASAVSQLAQMPKSDVANALHVSLKLPQTEWRQWPTIYQIVEELPDFDIDTWVTFLEKEDDPFVTNYSIKMAADNRIANSQRFIDFLHRSLTDKRVGGHLSGEAQAYAKNGLRVCDSVLNILWHREPEATRPPGYPFGVSNTSPEKRDRLIDDYAKKFGLVLATTSAKVNESNGILPEKQTAVVPKTKDVVKGISSSDKERAKSKLWLIVCLVIAVTGAAAWLLNKRSK